MSNALFTVGLSLHLAVSSYAVPLRCENRLVRTAASDDTDAPARLRFMLVTYVCPVDPGNGMIEVIKKNLVGMTYRGRFFYENDAIVRVTLEAAVPKGTLEVTKDVTRHDAQNLDDIDFVDKAAQTNEPLRRNGCRGDAAAREAYKQLMKNNRRLLEQSGD